MQIIKTTKYGKPIINRHTKQPITNHLLHSTDQCRHNNNILKRTSGINIVSSKLSETERKELLYANKMKAIQEELHLLFSSYENTIINI